MFEEILSRPSVNFPISFMTYIIVFGEAFILGLFISWIYKKKSISQDKAFQYSLWLIAPIVATLLLFIGSNLALSIGMVGSLSIIRFRTAIKDPADLMYLFLLIMIGLGCGTQNFAITAVATIFMATILLVLSGKRKEFAEDDVMILKDSKSDLVENAIKHVKESHSGVRLVQLSYGEKQTDATLHLKNFGEEKLMELKQKFPLQSLHLLKK